MCGTGTLAGCGVAVSASSQVPGRELTVYSSLPLNGPQAPISRQIIRGERLALAQARGHVGHFRVSLVSLDDASPQSGRWEPGIAATNARLATQDTHAIAYLGDLDSGATAVSLPLVNAAGIPQVSPGSAYIGLTTPLDAGQDEPQRFYPSDERTFVRLIPSDRVEAAAQVDLMRALHVRRLYVLSDEHPFHVSLAELVRAEAQQTGIAIAGTEELHVGEGLARPSEYAGPAGRVAASGAQAVFFSGSQLAAAGALWQELHARDAALWLLGSHDLATRAFASRVGGAARRTLLTSPYLPPARYGGAAQGVLRRYRAAFREAGQAPALYGYEAMSLVLQAIRMAGARAGSRQALLAKLFAIGQRHFALGQFAIDASGETTLRRYAFYRVASGGLAFAGAYPGAP
jgi:branched-chain amino acid transport system substrate-binding protein